jgi:hypothetical protein
MNKTEAELDMLVAELEYENKLLRARNQRLETEKTDWVCPFCYATKCETPDECKSLAIRNQVLEEIAHEFDQMKSLGDTAASFAAFIRRKKR